MPPAKDDKTNLAGPLEIARRDLLDLGLRNTLLNYRPLRTRGLEVVDEKPRELFRLLVKEEKSLTFLPGEEGGAAANGTAGENLLAQPEDDRNVATRHKDSRLQTAYASAELQARLLATYHAARTSMEEQGVNTLYLALGMLSWREEDSGKFCRAPLILIPVELERSDARARFHLRYTGEELGENVSLAEKLKQSFAIRDFPELPDVDDLDVDDYFQKVEFAVRGRSGWTVDREAIALGFFSFAKFLMYRDLDPATWPAADAILGHEILQSLLAERGFPPFSSDYRDDCLLDEQLQNLDLFHDPSPVPPEWLAREQSVRQAIASGKRHRELIVSTPRICNLKPGTRTPQRSAAALPSGARVGGAFFHLVGGDPRSRWPRCAKEPPARPCIATRPARRHCRIEPLRRHRHPCRRVHAALAPVIVEGHRFGLGFCRAAGRMGHRRA